MSKSLGLGVEGLRAGRLGGAEAQKKVWAAEMTHWLDGRLDALRYDAEFGVLADYVFRTCKECPNQVSYARIGIVIAIRVGDKEFRVRNSKRKREEGRNTIYVR